MKNDSLNKVWLKIYPSNAKNIYIYMYIYLLPLLRTQETRLGVFQFITNRRKIAKNDFLCTTDIKLTYSCSFCEETTETLHLPWNCKYTQALCNNIFG